MDTRPLCRPLIFMKLAGFLFLLLVPGHTLKTDDYLELLNALNLSRHNGLHSKFPPHDDKNFTVSIKMEIYGIINLNAKEQTFYPYIWIYMSWQNPHVLWTKKDFNGLERLVIPSDLLWMPDLTIEEMLKKEDRPKPDHLTITHDGRVEYRVSQAVLCTCRIQVYQFPFDSQRCNISFKSAVYSREEVEFRNETENVSERAWKRKRSEDEWEITHIAHNLKMDHSIKWQQSVIFYTITLKRRSVLYVANLLVPVLFIFFLDMASFLMSDSGSEKLGFQVTLLLSITVMQLLLNDILPSSSDKIPLIVVFCIGIFGLMMCNLLETILVMYLIEKDKKEEENPGCWTRMTKMINKVFIIVYILVTVVFFAVLVSYWRYEFGE